MRSIVSPSIRRNVGLFVLVLCFLFGGTMMVVRGMTHHLLRQNATSAAHNWADYLAANVSDLEQIASGEQPSTASMAFFQGTRKSGQVFRYKIFNRAGFSQLVSDHDQIALVDISEFSAEAARAMRIHQPVVDARKGAGPDQPAFFAEAYVPVFAGDRGIAVVAAYVDQTQQRDSFYGTFLIAAALLCLLTGLSFAVPTIAWYRRTREKQHADRRIRFLAHHDALTGLANRAQLFDRLETALATLRSGRGLAVHFVDLDRFKEVNDTFGHDGGDFLLKTIAERFRSVIRQEDMIARLGGDEFVVLQLGVCEHDTAEAFARRLAAALTAPMQFKQQQILATASIGVATAPTDGLTPERLLKSADLALYKSKADGRNCIRFFLPEMDIESKTRVELEKLIRDTTLCGGFELHYQPVFELSGHSIIGYEALIRLPKGDGTLIPPAVFIPVAEEMRLIDKIGEWVLREACTAATEWPEHLTIAVNVSPSQFAAGNVSEIVARVLAETGLAPQRLELEITETLLLGDSESIMAELQALKALGVAIVMDDFGAGYSSLSYLWRFPFDKIKIDCSFMQALDGSGRDAETVVKAIIALGRQLRMHVLIEGVENAKQAEFLEEARGDQAQGYFFGRPAPGTQISADILADVQHAAARQPGLREAEEKLLLTS